MVAQIKPTVLGRWLIRNTVRLAKLAYFFSLFVFVTLNTLRFQSENRYKVPKGTKFFRVRVKPVSSVQRDSRELAQSAYTSKQSTSMSTSQSVITTFDPLIEEPRLDDVVDISKEDESEVELKQEKSEDCGIEEATVATEQSER